MIWVNFGKWKRKVGMICESRRIYIKGRYTPIVRLKIREVWKVYKEYPDGRKTEEKKGRDTDDLGDLGCH